MVSAVPWKINPKMFPILVKVFNEGGNSDLSIPISEDKVVLNERLVSTHLLLALADYFVNICSLYKVFNVCDLFFNGGETFFTILR